MGYLIDSLYLIRELLRLAVITTRQYKLTLDSVLAKGADELF